MNGWGADIGQNNRAFYDLQANNGITLSDTNWVADYEMEITASSIPGHRPFMITENTGIVDPSAGGPVPAVILASVQDCTWGSVTRLFSFIVADAITVRIHTFGSPLLLDLISP